MKTAGFIGLSLAALAGGCSGQDEDKRTSKGQACLEKFEATAMSNWASRMARDRSGGTLTLAYELDFPFDDAKRLENALATLPGESQLVQFDGDGGVHVAISGASVPMQATAVASSDGTSATTPTIYPIAATLCQAVSAAKGTLTNVAVHTSGYRLDDGKLYAPAVN